MEGTTRTWLQKEQRGLARDELRFALYPLPRVSDDTPHSADPCVGASRKSPGDGSVDVDA
jgi:hypothetical protein